jgi:hypothetical protein
MKTLIIKSLLTSLYQREGTYPSLAKRGERRFFNNDILIMHSLVTVKSLARNRIQVSQFLDPSTP